MPGPCLRDSQLLGGCPLLRRLPGTPASSSCPLPSAASLGSRVVMHSIPRSLTIQLGQSLPGLSQGPGCWGPPCRTPVSPSRQGGLSGRSPHRPAPRGRTRCWQTCRDASCEQQPEHPTDGQPWPLPHHGAMASTEHSPLLPQAGPSHLCGPVPRPGTPHPGRLCTGPHSRKQEIHPERKHGRGACVHPAPRDLPPAAPTAGSQTHPSGTSPIGSCATPAQGKNLNPVPASPHLSPDLGRTGGACCSALGCRCTAQT